RSDLTLRTLVASHAPLSQNGASLLPLPREVRVTRIGSIQKSFIAAGVAGVALALALLPHPANAVQNAPDSKPAATATAPKKTEQIRGFSIQLTNATPEGAKAYLQAIDDLADMGCTWVNLAIAARQDKVTSEAISINWNLIPTENTIQQI